MKYKKASDPTPMQWMFIIIIGVITTIVVLTIFKGQSMSSSKVVSKYIESLSEDFDNDRINDFYDKSPCVAGEDLIIAESDGKVHYFFADVPTGGCEKVGTDPGYDLEEKTEEANGQSVCVLKDKSCAKLLKDFYDCLRDPKSSACSKDE